MADRSSLSSLMIVGGQWGDEGKGKVVDLLSAGFSAVVRYNGGHNAGHTVRFADRHFALHLVPSGIIHPDVKCYLGTGMVVDPRALAEEMDFLAGEDIDVTGRLFLSPRATLVLPTHRALDGARENARGSSPIGTTGRGIGPAYQDLAQRRALRAFILADTVRLADEAGALMEEHNRELERLHSEDAVDLDEALDELCRAAASLAPLLREVGPAVLDHARRGDPLLFEGAQGVLLDLLHGTYPFVTSSSCLPSNAAASCGVPMSTLGPVLGVMKAYITRVGGGPFPTELAGPEAEALRQRGNEFGTTTGRPRRCGWFDAVAGRYAVRVAGLDAVALMKLDVLDELDRVAVAVAYKLPDGRTLESLPADPEIMERVQPVYEELPGWRQPTVGLTDAAKLPAAARDYIAFIERQLGVPVVLVSTGPRREETLTYGSSALAEGLAPLLQRPEALTRPT